MDKLMKASWRTFVFSICGLTAIWDLTRTGKIGPEQFLLGLGGLLTLYGVKQALEYKKKQNGGTT